MPRISRADQLKEKLENARARLRAEAAQRNQRAAEERATAKREAELDRLAKEKEDEALRAIQVSVAELELALSEDLEALSGRLLDLASEGHVECIVIGAPLVTVQKLEDLGFEVTAFVPDGGYFGQQAAASGRTRDFFSICCGAIRSISNYYADLPDDLLESIDSSFDYTNLIVRDEYLSRTDYGNVDSISSLGAIFDQVAQYAIKENLPESAVLERWTATLRRWLLDAKGSQEKGANDIRHAVRHLWENKYAPKGGLINAGAKRLLELLVENSNAIADFLEPVIAAPDHDERFELHGPCRVLWKKQKAFKWSETSNDLTAWKLGWFARRAQETYEALEATMLHAGMEGHNYIDVAMNNLPAGWFYSPSGYGGFWCLDPINTRTILEKWGFRCRYIGSGPKRLLRISLVR